MPPITNDEIVTLLRKAGINLDTGGLLPEEVLNAFIDATVDQSDFLKAIRIERDIRTTRHLDALGAGSRMMQKHVEGTASENVQGVTVGRRSLTPAFTDLLYDLTFEWLRKNIEKEGAEQLVNTAFARQFRNDVVDLAWNGDTAAGAGDDQNFLKICDGYVKRIKADGDVHLFEREASTDWLGMVFPGLLKELPEKYRQDKNELAYHVGGDVDLEYRQQLGGRISQMGDNYIQNAPPVHYGGILVQPVPSVPYGLVVLTKKQNLAVGFGWEMESYRQLQPRKGTIEYTIYAHIDANYVMSDVISYCE